MACANTCRTADPSGYLACTNQRWPISEADVLAYTARSGAPQGEGAGPSGPASQRCVVSAMLRIGRMVVWKKAYGDCAVNSQLGLGTVNSITKYGSFGLAGVAATSGISLAATGGAGIGASAGGSGAALGGLPSIFGTVAGIAGLALIPFAIWGAFSRHHKIAVAREQATLCNVVQAWNDFEATMEAGIAAGQIAVADAKAAIPNIEVQLMGAMQAIREECNAACFYQKVLKALDLYAVEKLYDSLSPKGFFGNPANISQPFGTLKSSSIGKYAVAGVGSLAAVKLAGALV